MDDRPHPWWARFYARVADHAERSGAARYRSELVAGLSGRVLEVGCGPGLNFRQYPAVVTVEAIEPEPHLRRLAEARARSAAARVHVSAGLGERIAFADASFDAVVLCYVLCTVDAPAVLREVHRVLRPDGELRFWEHVRSEARALAAMQVAVDRLFWPRLGAGCHTSRNPLSAMEDAGFAVAEQRRFWFAPGLVIPAGPQLLGRARRC